MRIYKGLIVALFSLSLLGTAYAKRMDASKTSQVGGGWQDNGTSIVEITPTDNVGIGTTAPKGLLQVGTSPAPGLIVLVNGNTGIGNTLPGNKLEVTGTVAATTVTGANVTSGADPGHTHTSGSITEADPLSIKTDGTRGLSGNWYNGNYNIATLGNIGVGNTSPTSAKLQVTGNIQSDTLNTTTLNVTGNSSFGNITAGTWSGDVLAVGKIPTLDLGTKVSGTLPDASLSTNAVNHIAGTGPGVHSLGTISQLNSIDISANTNLAGDTENVLTGDALSIGSTITRDSEWNGLDFLVGTVTGTLSGEIVAGTAPGGELGGTWASPTIDDSLAVTSWNLTTPTITTSATMTDASTLGLGTGKGLIQFDDETTDFISFSNCNVGIGTTSPAQALQVVGTVQMTGFKLTTSPTNNYVLTSDANGVGTWASASAGSQTPITQNVEWAGYKGLNMGNLGIGISDPGTSRLAVMGGNVGIGSTAPKGLLQVGTEPNTPLTVLAGGNVGLGTTNPIHQLDVVGTSRLLGNVGIGGTSTAVALNVVGTIQTSQGIQFPATQSASADVNNLDDYEEGTWTAGWTSGTGSITITDALKTGIYTKIGRLVVCSLFCTIDSVSSPTGALTLTGLPFTSANVNSSYAGVSGFYDGLETTAATVVQGRVNKAASTVTFQRFAAGAAANNAADIKAGSDIELTICYNTT